MSCGNLSVAKAKRQRQCFLRESEASAAIMPRSNWF